MVAKAELALSWSESGMAWYWYQIEIKLNQETWQQHQAQIDSLILNNYLVWNVCGRLVTWVSNEVQIFCPGDLSVIHNMFTRWQHNQHNRKCPTRCVGSNGVVEVL